MKSETVFSDQRLPICLLTQECQLLFLRISVYIGYVPVLQQGQKIDAQNFKVRTISIPIIIRDIHAQYPVFSQ